MSVLSRALGRGSLVRIGAGVLGLAWLGMLGAFAYASTTIRPSSPAIVAAVAALLIAGAGTLYAWREPGR